MDVANRSVAGRPRGDPYAPSRDIFTPPRSGIGLVCGFAAADSRLYYNRVPLVINFSYTQNSQRAALTGRPLRQPRVGPFFPSRGVLEAMWSV